MKIVFESRGRGVSPQEVARKLENVLELLAKRNDPLLIELAHVLRAHTPLNILDTPPADEIAAWIEEFLRFLDERQEQISIRIVPAATPGGVVLLTNTPDAPFLLDSLQNLLARRHLRNRVLAHPILSIRRRRGKIVRLGGVGAEGVRESFIIVELQRLSPKEIASLEGAVRRVLHAVLLAHRDRETIRQRLRSLEDSSELGIYRDFLQWLQKGNFLPFSYRCLQVRLENGGHIQEVEGSAMGLPPDPQELTCCRQRPLDDFEGPFRERIRRHRPIVVETIARRSPIHRDEPLVYLGFREQTREGEVREHAFLGLFTQKSVDEPAFNVPSLRRRIEKALDSLCIPDNSHDYRKTVEIFNSFPKVELFFMEEGELMEIVRSFALLYRQGMVKVVATRSLAVHGLTLLLIMPREFYHVERERRMERYLKRYFRAHKIESRVIHISPDYLSLHVTLHPRDEEFRVDLDRLEMSLTNLIRPWELRMRLLLIRHFGEEEGRVAWRRYAESFSREYRLLIHPRLALRDIRSIEGVLKSGEEVFDLWGPFRSREEFYRLQFYSLRESYLNELMPLLENLNLCIVDEVDFTLSVERRKVFIKSFSIRGVEGSLRLSELKPLLLDALTALRKGVTEDDYLNRLLVLTGLSWRQIDIFRGYLNYDFQLGSPFSKRRVAFALINNPKIALLLYRYFEARFHPGDDEEEPWRREEKTLSPLRMELAQALEEVNDLNEDRILRTLFNLIDSTVRTNFFLRVGRRDFFFSFKISAIGIIDMPAPRPLFETYVHSARMEGIHLRGGKVARGGIRWSDRPDDFRTEILGLMKTQMTKNALIVPVGSKGGFIVKTPWNSREEGAELSKEAYRTLMRGLLDLTDNRVADRIVRPAGLVAYDEEDPYLVVAADKGTAHLPDTANAVSREYDFWLGDAFASGGSHGYDHKKLGITARGAWESVKRHFREMGRDIQREPFTVIGIGDMSGDVFGNGMLLSRQIRLLAAFDHRHIFLDPDPDPEISFRERSRLFSLPRSSWADYRPELISKGGGVWPRSAKEIPLSSELRRWLGVRHTSIDPMGLMRLILTAEVDLLWNGGIGTYVKASTEKNDDVGDRANDALRIDASQLRAKVVGEGGNLGLTQRGRIEFALQGGRINTDAVDNSAGVDTSDHEVNLKILMQHLQQKGVIAAGPDRDRILGELTEEVCEAVLANTYGQGLCISLDVLRSADDVEPFLQLADRLADAGLLDRRGEFLPSAKEVMARSERSLTRPELAILMAYAKMQIFQALVESDLCESKEVGDFLQSYFPTRLRREYAEFIPSHPLAREICATVITNAVVGQCGSAFFAALTRRTGASLVAGVRTYLAFDRVLEGESIRRHVNALDNRVPAARQYRYLLDLENTLATLSLWALDHGLDIAAQQDGIELWKQKMSSYLKSLASLLPEQEWSLRRREMEQLEEDGFSPETARLQAMLLHLGDFLPVATIASEFDDDIYPVARIYGEVRSFAGIGDLLQRMEDVPIRDRWDRLSSQAVTKRLNSVVFDLSKGVWREAEGNPETFFARRRSKVRSLRTLQQQVRQITPANFHPFTVLLTALEDLRSED